MLPCALPSAKGRARPVAAPREVRKARAGQLPISSRELRVASRAAGLPDGDRPSSPRKHPIQRATQQGVATGHQQLGSTGAFWLNPSVAGWRGAQAQLTGDRFFDHGPGYRHTCCRRQRVLPHTGWLLSRRPRSLRCMASHTALIEASTTVLARRDHPLGVPWWRRSIHVRHAPTRAPARGRGAREPVASPQLEWRAQRACHSTRTSSHAVQQGPAATTSG